MADRPVPGLVVVRDPGPRESYAVLHARSRSAVVCDLAGPVTAELAAEDLDGLPDVDWTASRERIADVADLLLYVEPAVERVARRHGGVTLGGTAVYAP
jgi:hypothetical protein